VDAPTYYVGGTRNDTNYIRRDLEGYYIFFISVSGVLGAGLYLRSAAMLQVGSPVAVLVPYGILTLSAWLVMQCIGEMIGIWPVSGALILFIEKFVDKELASIVGVATYSIGFASLIVAAAGAASIWELPKALLAGCFLVLFPCTLILFNLLVVRWYGRLEVVGGSVKLMMTTIGVVMMCAINAGAGDEGYLGGKKLPSSANVYDRTETVNQGQAFFIALQIAAFAFVGIVIPAAAAVEARLTRRNVSLRTERPAASSQSTVQRTWYNRIPIFRSQPSAVVPAGTEAVPSSGYEVLEFSAIWLPVITGLVYLLGGCLIVPNVNWEDIALPRWQSWVTDP
jgi:amino acid transporter